MHVPKTVTEERSFLGFMNYYHKFIPKYAQVAKPINWLVSGENANKKKTLVKRTEECQIAFEHLKHYVIKHPFSLMQITQNLLNCMQMLVKMV